LIPVPCGRGQDSMPTVNWVECPPEESDLHCADSEVARLVSRFRVCVASLCSDICRRQEGSVFLRFSLHYLPRRLREIGPNDPLSRGTRTVRATLMCTAVTRRFLFAAL
jgi:hypothetical protein